MKKIEVNGKTYWYLEGVADMEKRHMSLREELLGRDMLGILTTIEDYVRIHEKHGFPFAPPTSRVGRYAMTNHGLMYHAYGKYFKLLSNPGDISNDPFEGEVHETRQVSSFDF